MLIKAQRTYAANSVLKEGNWYKIAVREEGIYKVDIAFLIAAGINTTNLSSSAIRLFGNGGQMIEENNNTPRPDDLPENAIMVFDGGDGIFNNNDYFIFYATGPDGWKKDSVNATFKHRKNIYSDQSYYFIQIGGTGSRIATSNALTPNISINSFNARYFHELDTVNFLKSGRQWYGEEFSNSPGQLTNRNFNVNIPGITNNPVTLVSNVVSRSFNAFSRFDIKINNTPILQQNMAYTGSGVYDPFGVENEQTNTVPNTQTALNITYNYTPGSANAQGWLNWFEVHTRANLNMQGYNQITFRDWQTVSPGNIGLFTIQNASAAQVWDITNKTLPLKMLTNINGNDLQFSSNCNSLHEYIAFNSNNFLLPFFIEKTANQNLHNSLVRDLLIVVHPTFLNQAQRLAQHHTQKDNLRCMVVTTEQVYNEFSGGSRDAGAIRDFTKMFFDRAAGDSTRMPKYLLLFGDASFDYKDRIGNNTNYVPCWQSANSLEPLATYTSDDFYGFLNDTEDINDPGILNLLDIGIGRIPVKNNEEATAVVDKIISYSSASSAGPWRNEFTFIADDEDANLHLQDAETVTATVTASTPVFNQTKVYLDAYQQESGSGGNRYPAANTVINNKIFTGNLIWNYNGHGNDKRLADEIVLDADIINSFNNENKLPLFITATCDFAPYDNPFQNSIGENILLRQKSGAIALLTTTRLVFSNSNRIINTNYFQFALLPKANGQYLSLGESLQKTKNYTYQNYSDIINNRKFTLLGDPALTLAYPVNKVQTDSINNKVITNLPDTIKALGKYRIAGKVKDVAGNLLNTFNGTVYPVIFDKKVTVSTLANDAGSMVTAFQTQNNVLYKGKAKVTNGLFSFTFIAPKDINYNYGSGKISYYAEEGIVDANGSFTNFIVGGINPAAIDDKEGPVIKAWMNDEKFINGGICNETAILLVRLKDSSGMNTSGIGTGHSIIAVLDNDNRRLFELNDFYEADTDSYQSGKIRFQLPKLEPGRHTLKIKAWDVFNNSNEYLLEFIVANDDGLTINHVLNYPNPFTTKTSFWFEHNHPGEDLQVRIRIFTVSGKLVKNIQQTINTPGNRSCEVEWDGKDDYGAKIGRGVYIYQLEVSYNQKKSSTFEKMIIF